MRAKKPDRALVVLAKFFQDQQAWRRLFDIYAPQMYNMARLRGLKAQDAEDIMIDVFADFAKVIDRFDPARSPVENYLKRAMKNRIVNFYRKNVRIKDQAYGCACSEKIGEYTGGESTFTNIPSRESTQEEEAEATEGEYSTEKRIFRIACKRVQDEFTRSEYKAFWLTAAKGQTPREVADLLEMSAGHVILAKNKVLARVTEELEVMKREGIWKPVGRVIASGLILS